MRLPFSQLLIATAIVGSGCATGSTSSGEDISPKERAVRAGHQKIRGGVQQAFQKTESSAPYTLPARYNPPKCEGPDYEVFAHGRWNRVFLNTDATQRERLESLESDEQTVTDAQPVRFEGEWNGSRTTESGLDYPVFRVKSIERP